MFHTGESLRRPKGTGFLLVSPVLLAIATGGFSAWAATKVEKSSIQGSIRVDDDLKALAKIDSEEAKEKALAALKGATVTEVELEVEDGYLVYEVELLLGTQKLEIELIVDAGDGTVLAVEDGGGQRRRSGAK